MTPNPFATLLVSLLTIHDAKLRRMTLATMTLAGQFGHIEFDKGLTEQLREAAERGRPQFDTGEYTNEVEYELVKAILAAHTAEV